MTIDEWMDDKDLSTRTRNVLRGWYITVERLEAMTDKEIRNLPGLGAVGLKEIRRYLPAPACCPHCGKSIPEPPKGET